MTAIHPISEFPLNIAFWCGLCSWCLAQSLKMLLSFRRTKRLDMRYFVSTGGMPSAHSALVSGLATSIGMLEGFSSPVFALAMAFAVITMFDASTVRYAAGQQARIINEMVAEFSKEHHIRHARLKELLGHTRTEVIAGMFTGIVMSAVLTKVLAQRI